MLASITAKLAAAGAVVLGLIGAVLGLLAKGRADGREEQARATKDAAALKKQEMDDAGDAVDRSRAGIIERLRGHGF